MASWRADAPAATVVPRPLHHALAHDASGGGRGGVWKGAPRDALMTTAAEHRTGSFGRHPLRLKPPSTPLSCCSRPSLLLRRYRECERSSSGLLSLRTQPGGDCEVRACGRRLPRASFFLFVVVRAIALLLLRAEPAFVCALIRKTALVLLTFLRLWLACTACVAWWAVLCALAHRCCALPVGENGKNTQNR